jgi:hypothetical protein
VDEALEKLKSQIRAAFANTPPPDPNFLRNSSEGDEPYLLEDEFRDKRDWTALRAPFLDQSPEGFATALSFFSREAFRFYLPAYLLADLDGQLQHAEPLFHLWHGLDDDRRNEPVNVRRFGGWTWFEAISERMDAFAVAEVRVIVDYMRYKADRDSFARPKIEQALRNYWLVRLG